MGTKKTNILINIVIFIVTFAGFCGFKLYKRKHDLKTNITTVTKIKFDHNINGLKLLTDTSTDYLRYSRQLKPSYRIVLVVDGSCSTCFETLIKWKDLFETEHLPYEKLLIFGYDCTYPQLKYVQSELPELKAPIFYDPYYSFGKLNHIDQNGINKYLLVDEDFNVITAGNPFLDQGIMNTYLHYIK
ncbi:MAG: hypothetical protein JWR38_2843 [Mucilaginibacter sp.]|nr:hypothetical protein [Mucilaginibacter sp.]